jgi:hypothetical protein
MSEWAEGNGHKDLPRPGTGRRRSLITLLVLLVALPATFVISSLLGPGWRPVVSVASLEREEVVYIPAIRVFVVDEEPGPVALSAITAGGDRVLFCHPTGLFHGPGGLTFDRTGSLISGSAPRGLDRVGVRVQEGLVEVNPEIVTRGSPPSSEHRLLGRHCQVPGPEDPAGFASEVT